MKTSKNIIVLMLMVCICFLGIASFLEFASLKDENIFKVHKDFFQNISLGVFASGILVLVPSIVQYLTEKKRYHIEILRVISNILLNALDIIACMENYSQNSLIATHFESFRLNYNELIQEYSTFTKLLKLSKKDKLIESIISDTYKFILIHEELLKYSKQVKENKLKEIEYKKRFDTARSEMINYFRNEFYKYQRMIDDETNDLIKNKNINKYY